MPDTKLQFEDALEVVQWLDDITNSETTILLKTELTKVIFEVQCDNGVTYDIGIDIYEEPASTFVDIYDRSAGKIVYEVGA